MAVDEGALMLNVAGSVVAAAYPSVGMAAMEDITAPRLQDTSDIDGGATR